MMAAGISGMKGGVKMNTGYPDWSTGCTWYQKKHLGLNVMVLTTSDPILVILSFIQSE